MVSVTILTKNSQKYLSEVLEALGGFSEIVIYDTGSSDKTLSIARQFPSVTIYEEPFIGFGPTHNKASACASNDWILSIDSDEIVTPELAQEISQLNLERGTVYSIPRHNEYKGKLITGCGWYPDYQVRLYHRQDTRFSDAQVHEAVITDNTNVVRLKNPLKHYSYSGAADFLHKMQNYSELFAKQNQGRRKASVGKAVMHGLYAFFKSYILKRGFINGSQGFEISVYNANTAFYKYIKLAEINQKM